MRYLLLASVILAAPASAAPVKHHVAGAAGHASLPGFTFLGHDPDVAEPNPTNRDGSACSPDDKTPGEVNCSEVSISNPVMVGDEKVEIFDRSYYNGKLFSIMGLSNEGSFVGLLQAFTAKYGTPVLGTKPWQNKAGATFNNSTATWKFRNGTLELDSMGIQRDEPMFEFKALQNYPPATAPKINF